MLQRKFESNLVRRLDAGVCAKVKAAFSDVEKLGAMPVSDLVALLTPLSRV